MSERKKRSAALKVITDELERLHSIQEQHTQQENAFALAKQALTGEPRQQVNCELLIHYVPAARLRIEICVCSECGKENDGWRNDWKFCPSCGSAVVKAERETSPVDRHNREQAADLMEGLKNTFNGENQNGKQQ